MHFEKPLQKGRFLSRPNRFACWAELEGRRTYCHLPNPGRLNELMREGAAVWVMDRTDRPDRRTTHDLLLVSHPDALVCLDSRLPTTLLEEAIHEQLLPAFEKHSHVRREVTYGDSRLDAVIHSHKNEWLVETKSCTLVIDGVARFPDAPTVRGTRHMEELLRGTRNGLSAAVVFVIQRNDAALFAPHHAMDPEFTAALKEAADGGVEVFAIECDVSVHGVRPIQQIPVDLTA